MTTENELGLHPLKLSVSFVGKKLLHFPYSRNTRISTGTLYVCFYFLLGKQILYLDKKKFRAENFIFFLWILENMTF